MDEIHNFVEFFALKTTGKYLPFSGHANLQWYKIASYHIGPELHNALFHSSASLKDVFLGTGPIGHAKFVGMSGRFGQLHNSSADDQNKAIIEGIQSIRDRFSNTKVKLRPDGGIILAELEKIREKLVRLIKRRIKITEDENSETKFHHEEIDYLHKLCLLWRPKDPVQQREKEIIVRQLNELNIDNFDENYFYTHHQLVPVDFDTLMAEPPEKIKEFVSTVVRPLDTANLSIPAECHRFVLSYCEAHKSGLDTMIANGEYEKNLLAYFLQNANNEFEVLQAIAHQIYESPETPPMLLNATQAFQFLSKPGFFMALFRVLGDYRPPVDDLEIERRVVNFGVFSEFIRVLKICNEKITPRQLLTLRDFELDLEKACRFVHKMLLPGVQEIFKENDPRVFNAVLFELIMSKDIFPRQRSAALNFFIKRISEQNRWRDIILESKFKNMAEVLVFFCPKQSIIREIKPEGFLRYVNLLVKLIYRLTFDDPWRLLVISLLNYLTRVEEYDFIETNFPIFEQFVTNLLSSSPPLSVMHRMVQVIIARGNDFLARESKNPHNNPRTPPYDHQFLILLGVPIVGISSDAHFKDMASLLQFEESQVVTQASIIFEAFN
jgi:hypothetical protein